MARLPGVGGKERAEPTFLCLLFLILVSYALLRIRSVRTREEHKVRELSSTIDIDAPVERVWLIITNFAAYPQWNRFMQRIRGELIPGRCLEFDVLMLGRRRFTFKGKVLVVQPESTVQWSGHLVVPGLLGAEHRMTLERLSDRRTRFTQRTRLTGLLVPSLGSEWRTGRQSLMSTLETLKLRAEAGALARSRR